MRNHKLQHLRFVAIGLVQTQIQISSFQAQPKNIAGIQCQVRRRTDQLFFTNLACV